MNGLIRCAECGKLIARGAQEMVYADGRFYCEKCADEVLFECENCREKHHVNNMKCVIGNYGDEYWCVDCAESDATWCEDRDSYCLDAVWLEDREYYVSREYAEHNCYCCTLCGNWHYDYTTYTSDGKAVCSTCLYDNYEYCNECNEYVPNDDYDYDLGMCYECARTIERSNARVRGYHEAPPLQFIGDILPSWNGSWRGIGCELEVDSASGYSSGCNMQEALNAICELANEHLHFEHDGSLNYGFEIVTQPHSVDAFREMPWEDILRVCEENGFSSHDAGTCGLHLHFSREMFGADEETQANNIAKLMQFYELYWDEIIKMSRRTEAQANSWARRYCTNNKNKLIKYAKKEAYAGRYMAINNTNDHTVEIRIFRGTLNYNTFMACIDFMVKSVENSCRMGWSDTTDDIEWIRGCDENTLNYMSRVGAFAEARQRLANGE